MHELAIITFYIEPEEAVWIGPKPFGDCSLHCDFFPDVEHRVRVVRE
jgi:hypothetical protein